MLKEFLFIIVFTTVFWILQAAGITTYSYVVILGVILLIFGFVFVVAMSDTLEGVWKPFIKIGVIFIILGLSLILLTPSGLPKLF